MNRKLYLAAYDVVEPSRIPRLRRIVIAHAYGGQKSAFECWLSSGERRELLERAQAAMDPERDRFLVVRLDPAREPLSAGVARPFADPLFFYLG